MFALSPSLQLLLLMFAGIEYLKQEDRVIRNAFERPVVHAKSVLGELHHEYSPATAVA